MTKAFSNFLKCEQGATSIEYALIASGIALVIIPAVYSLGGSIKGTLYDKVAEGLNTTN